MILKRKDEVPQRVQISSRYLESGLGLFHGMVRYSLSMIHGLLRQLHQAPMLKTDERKYHQQGKVPNESHPSKRSFTPPFHPPSIKTHQSPRLNHGPLHHPAPPSPPSVPAPSCHGIVAVCATRNYGKVWWYGNSPVEGETGAWSGESYRRVVDCFLLLRCNSVPRSC